MFLRLSNALAPLALIVATVACGGAASTSPAPSPAVPKGASLASSSAPAPATPPVRLADELSRAMPEVDVYVEAPDVRALFGPEGFGGVASTILVDVLRGHPDVGRVAESQVRETLAGLRQVALGVGFHGGRTGILLRFDEPTRVESLLAAAGLVPIGEVSGYLRYAPGGAVRDREGELVWSASERLLLVGDRSFVDSVFAVANGHVRPVAARTEFAAALTRAGNPQGLTVVADLSRAGLKELPGGLSTSRPAVLTVSAAPSNTVALEVAADGGLAGLAVSAPSKLTLASRLPESTLMHLAYSTRAVGTPEARYRSLSDALRGVVPFFSKVDDKLAELGLSGATLMGDLGDEGVVAVVLAPNAKPGAPIEEQMAVVLSQRLKSSALAKRYAGLLARAEKVADGYRASRDSTTLRLVPKDPKGGAPSVVVSLAGDLVFVGLGAVGAIDHALDAHRRGDGERAKDESVDDSKARLGSLVVNLARVVPFSDPEVVSLAGSSALAALAALPPLVLDYAPVGDETHRAGARLELSGLKTLSPMAPVMTAAFRRYLARAKTAEAKSTVRALARAAVTRFDRLSLDASGAIAVPTFCKSAPSVPAEVPRATSVTTSKVDGQDFLSGDARQGWKCLAFTFESPIRYRYSYRAGGGYLGPSRGGPDPGVSGFEVAAEGDLDGDGKTSLFTVTGTFDPVSKQIMVGRMFSVDETE